MSLLAVVVLAATVAEPPSIDEFFAEFAKHRDRIAVLEARFVQRSITRDEAFTSEGTLVYARPKRIVFRYSDPEETYLVDTLRWYEYVAELKQLRIFQLEERPEAEALFLGFDTDSKRLQEAYHVELIEPGAEDIGAKVLVLRPKAAEADGAYFERVTLYLREEDYLPYRVEIVNDAESQVIHEFRDFRVNPPLDPSQTQIALPEGTKIIEDDKFVEKVGPGGIRVPEAGLPQPSSAEPDSQEPDAP